MEVTDFLKREHDIVRQILDDADVEVAAMTRGEAMDAVKVASIVEFLRTFLDGCHRVKEDQRLFPLLERSGTADFEIPLAVLRREHDEGRERVRLLSIEAERAMSGKPASLRKLSEALGEYVVSLRRHMMREEEQFFPLVKASLTPLDQEELINGFLASDEAWIAGDPSSIGIL